MSQTLTKIIFSNFVYVLYIIRFDEISTSYNNNIFMLL